MVNLRTDDAVVITVLFGAHRPFEDKAVAVRAINKSVVDAVGVSPDDIFIALIPVPADSFSFGGGELQPAGERRAG